MNQRRYLLYLFCTIVIACITVFTPSALAATGMVTGKVVNLRTGPGTNYQVSGQLGQGSIVSILTIQNEWYQVKLTNGDQGWMSNQYLKNIGTTITPASGAKSIADLRQALLNSSSITGRLQKDLVNGGNQVTPGVTTNGKPAYVPVTPSRGSVDRNASEVVNLEPISTGQTVIVIDSGHGGTDPGAIYSGANEKDLNLSMGLKLGQTLEQAGYQVIYTRNEDRAVSLANRSQIANTANAALFVSIHCNASTNKDLSGTTTYYSVNENANLTNERLKLATAVQSSLVSNLGISDKGVRTARFQVTRETIMPSILVETAFMSNSNDVAILSNEDKQWVFARSIAQGIVNYLNGA